MRPIEGLSLLVYAAALLNAVYSFTGGSSGSRKNGGFSFVNVIEREGSWGKTATSSAPSSSSIQRRGHGLSSQLWMGTFNPFTGRQKNTRVRWFDTELSKFYNYVESQPLLTHEQELQYGKALSMWIQVCSVRDRMQAERMAPVMLQPPEAATLYTPTHGSGGDPSNTTPPPLSYPASILLPSVIEPEIKSGESMHSRVLSNASPRVPFPDIDPLESIESLRALDQLDKLNKLNMKSTAVADIEAHLGVTLPRIDETMHTIPEAQIPLPLPLQLDSCSIDVGSLVGLDNEEYDSRMLECEITLDELAAEVGCTPSTLDKMQRCAEISRTRLVNSNLKLVLAVVSRYRTSAIPNSELIAEGTRGLSRAVDRYDYSKGFRFATYATWYVHQAISEYVRWRKHPAKMPSRYLLLQRKVREFTSNFKTENKKFPEVKEIAAALQAAEFDIVKVLTMQTYPLLLNAPISFGGAGNKGSGDGKDRTMQDMVASKFKNPTTITGSNDLRNDMEKLMRTNLNEVERDVLRLRLGLDDGRAKAVKEVGKRFKISWKQVRSVEKEALSKLLGSEEIRDFVAAYEEQPVSI